MPLLPLVAAAAILGRLLALHAWWCLDDWGQLADAAGLIERSGGARRVSQHLYWAATWPLVGLSPAPHAVLRILLHALAAAAVARIALHAGPSRTGALLDVGLGHDDRAVAHLRRARELGADPVRFVYEDAKSGARPLAARRARLFADHLAAAAAHGRLTPAEAATLNRDFQALLRSSP